MFKHFILLALLVFITPQFLFSQDDGKYVLYNNSQITDAVDLKTTIMLVIDVNTKRTDKYQVSGTYYEYRGNSWNNIGNLHGTISAGGKYNGEAKVYDNKYNAEGTIINGSASINREGEIAGYHGGFIPEIGGIYYKSSNENDVCRVAQEGPFLELIDENSNTSKGIIISKYKIYSIDGNKSASIEEKDKITFSDGILWTKTANLTKGFTGNWLTSYGEWKLTQSGNNLSGKNVYNPYTVNGTVAQSGDTLIFTGKWKDDSNDGDVIFKLFGDSFKGRWNYSKSPTDWHEDWNGSRMADK